MPLALNLIRTRRRLRTMGTHLITEVTGCGSHTESNLITLGYRPVWQKCTDQGFEQVSRRREEERKYSASPSGLGYGSQWHVPSPGPH